MKNQGYSKKQKSQEEQKQVMKERKEKLSIKVKLILSHVLILLIPVIVIILVLFMNARNAILEEVEQANMAVADQVTSLVNLKNGTIESSATLLISDNRILEIISKTVKDYSTEYDMVKDRQDNLFDRINALRLSVPDLQRVLVINPNEVIDPNKDKDDVYKKPEFKATFEGSEENRLLTEGGVKALWAYHLYETQDLFYMRTFRNNAASGAITTIVFSVSPTVFINDLKNSQLAEGARMSLVDGDGKVVVSSDDELLAGEALVIADELKVNIQKSIEATGESKAIPRGAFVTTQNVSAETMVVFKETATGWTYVMEIPTASIYGNINNIGLIAIFLAVMSGVIALVIGTMLAFTIAKPIDYIRSKMKLVEQGDLTVRSTITGHTEIGQLSHSFNLMIENMSLLINETSNISHEVDQDSDELRKIANQSALASKEVVEAVESLSKGAVEQATDADKAAIVINELVKQLGKTEESFSEVVEVTKRTKMASAQATKTIQELSQTTTKSIELSGNIKNDMATLAERFNEILGIIDMINAISSQTNLLALNAAIEAARAGDAGKGFAVVADEVRKLASQSSEAAKSISDIVNNIYQATKKTEDMIEAGSVIYGQQGIAVRNTENTFSEIVADMDNIMLVVERVYQLLSGLDVLQDQATDSISSIAAIAEESASAIEEILATGEEQTAVAEHLSSMASSLSEVIKVLKNNVTQFKV